MHHDDMGIDWNTDTMDGGNHMSFDGSKKTTAYLEDFLKSNYTLTDHRDDERFESWKKYNEEYELY